AALEATLRLYLDEPSALREIPTLRALVAPPETLRARAVRLAAAARATGAEVTLEEGISQVGGGSLPGEELPVTLVCIRPEGLTAGAAARALRLGEPPIFCRIHRDALVFDLRTVTDPELEAVIVAIQQLRDHDASHRDGS